MDTLAYTYLSLAYDQASVEQGDAKLPLSRYCLRILGGILMLGYLSAPAQAVLQPGDQGAGVVALQTFLAQQGYFPGEATGYYGAVTKAAVIRYQQAQGLTPDGIVGIATQQTFCSLANSSTKQLPPPRLQPQRVRFVAQQTATPSDNTVLSVGSAGEQVRLLQQRLRALGYLSEDVTGYFGEVTQKAVIQFQRDRGLTPDGLVGQNTLTTLQATTPNPPVAASPQVRDLQQRLKHAGFYQGAIDGIWGPQTQAALEAAQQAFSIRPSALR